MKQVLHFVPYGNISYTIPSLIENLHKSELWTGGRAAVDDIVKFVFTGQMHLWVIDLQDGMGPRGHLITEFKQYPKSKMFVVQYCATDIGMLQEVSDDIFTYLEKIARDSGCNGIEFFGRIGWKPTARKHGYEARTSVYEKYFDEVAP